ncbi:osmotically-inducible protein OsmY [Herbaspirillum sp. SJZ130]|nr:osmotically-inducible protein OsmY [Herbaspirillum sp. SJZ130]TQK15442.1 osmotically-inducible protein OsmY [Herbaspirillum sp. SJZ106]TWC71337.1 osmotically-inducible protein OsmY [Herbaspirillum sp. SJZ099]
MAELQSEPALTPAQIGVDVKDGVVTLTGQVDSFTAKWGAESAAKRVAGMMALAVEMEVRLPGTIQRADRDIARSVCNVLSWMPHFPQDAIGVTCEKGWVTLSGEVQWKYQRESAHAAVRQLMGVLGTSNQILIKPASAASLAKDEIEAALNDQAHVDAKDILVSIHGAEVTLSGNVHSIAERYQAKNSVWRSPGVNNVIDHLTVS